MPYSDAKEAYDFLVTEAILPSLKQHKFKSKRPHFFLRGEGTWIALNIQKWRFGPSQLGGEFESPPAVRFTLNLGVLVDEVELLLPSPMPVPSPPTEASCHWRWRIGRFLPTQGDTWWDVADREQADRLIPEITSVMTEVAIPVMLRFSNPTALLAYLLDTRGEKDQSALRAAALAKCYGTTEQFELLCRHAFRRSRGQLLETHTDECLERFGWTLGR